jgi:hypothetical protein
VELSDFGIKGHAVLLEKVGRSPSITALGLTRNPLILCHELHELFKR